MYGLYYLPPAMMLEHANLSQRRLDALLALFEELNFAKYDHALQFVWVVEMAHWQLGLTEPMSPKDRRVVHANNWYRSLPKTIFLREFYDRYWDYLHLSVRREAPERAAATVTPQAASPSVAVVKSTPPGPNKLELFEQWWKHYPKKVGKRAALAEWMNIKPAPDDTFVARAIEVLEYQKRQPDWLKEGGQFIPDPERYLKKGRYADEIRDVPRLTDTEASTATSLLNWANS